MDLRSPSEIAALKADSFGRISLMQGPDGPFVRRDLAHVPLWLRLPAWWLARREALALRKVAGMADVPQLLDWTGRHLDRSFMAGDAMYQRPPHGDLIYFRRARRLLWWPDTLPPPARRELRLAASALVTRPTPDSMAP